jgi:GH24 family phage-related lysozyme (muramidase)
MSETKVKLEVQPDGSAKPGSADTNTTLVAVLDLKPLQIRLIDRKGKPMADEPFVVTLADGREIKGKLDLQGRAAVPCAYAKDAKVTFPRLAPSAWKKKTVTAPQKKVDAGELGLDEVCEDLVRWEGKLSYMYLDSRGYVTVGIGNLVSSSGYAKSLGFLNAATHQPAKPEEVEKAFNAVKSTAISKKKAIYRQHPSIELPAEKLAELAKARLTKEFLPNLKKRFPDFDSLPKPARRGLIDMIYNLGVGNFATQFDGKHSKFGPAVRRHDWDMAGQQCDVSSSRVSRNEWRRAQFQLAFAQEPVPLPGK